MTTSSLDAIVASTSSMRSVRLESQLEWKATLVGLHKLESKPRRIHQPKMPLFSHRNNRGTSSNGTNPPQQPNQPSNGMNGTRQPDQQANVTTFTRDDVARGLAQIRIGSIDSISQDQASLIRRKADAFLNALEAADLLEFFKPAIEQRWSPSDAFKTIITKLAEEGHLDLIQQSAELMPQDWAMDHRTNRAGQRIVLVRAPPDGWATFGEFPRLEDLSD
ncbi:hypothetical protein PRZ48_011880 [Zasmidium cellare]|uniref:Uncharacterized protein n=1 Tax=Zasmidium cellare TaxID=395010 RepID=A0ABR0E7X8_ZASCE|nr:hypothetical protein PRZ48_011880 [Zasmidium cellare]